MLDSGKEEIRTITPSRKVINLSVFEGELSTEEGFRRGVSKLSPEERLPDVFPRIPDYLQERKTGLVTNTEYKDYNLRLPQVFYNSDIYRQRPEVRGPMEEIILAYERERARLGLEMVEVTGGGGGGRFRKRLKRIQFPRVTKTEQKEVDEDELPKLPVSGTKIA